MKGYFNQYHSNTICSTCNQSFFSSMEKMIGRAFFKIANGGEYHYSFLFTSTVDSTYSDGSISKANDLCDYYMENVRIAVADKDYFQNGIEKDVSDIEGWLPITFHGENGIHLKDGQTAYSDEILLDIKKDEYICMEINYRGTFIPYLAEAIIPIYTLDGKWNFDCRMPLPNMIGCDRPIQKCIAFLGDSITEGCGTQKNAYEHWNAVLTSQMNPKNAYWNLGIGYGRGSDASRDGAWMEKALQNDAVFVCFGVNDIFKNKNEERTVKDIIHIVERLREEQIFVVLQSVPPFSFTDEDYRRWRYINEKIEEYAVQNGISYFDNVNLLGDPEGKSKFGTHPNGEGCKIWGEALYRFIRDCKQFPYFCK